MPIKLEILANGQATALNPVASVKVVEVITKGAKGDPGRDGTNGANGRDGTNGAPGTNGTNGTNGAPGTNGTNGVDGKSAYQQALDGGFVGTQAAWIASLKGAKGDTGATGSGALLLSAVAPVPGGTPVNTLIFRTLT